MTISHKPPREAGPIRRKLEAWLQIQDLEVRSEQLFDWLQGYGFLPFDQDHEPYYLIASAIAPGSDGAGDRKRFAEGLVSVLDRLGAYLPRSARPEQAVWNVFQLCVEVAHPAILWPPLSRILDESRSKPDTLPLDGSWRTMSIRTAFLNAIANNQIDDFLAEDWLRELSGQAGILGAAPDSAWAGLIRIPRSNANWPRQIEKLGAALRVLTSENNKNVDRRLSIGDIALQYGLAVSPPRNFARELLEITDTSTCVSLSQEQIASLVPACVPWFERDWACWKPVGKGFVAGGFASTKGSTSNGRYLVLSVLPRLEGWIQRNLPHLQSVRHQSLPSNPIAIDERVWHMIDEELVDQIRGAIRVAGEGADGVATAKADQPTSVRSSRHSTTNRAADASSKRGLDNDPLPVEVLHEIHKGISIAAISLRP